jgi:hypothetical protein
MAGIFHINSKTLLIRSAAREVSRFAWTFPQSLRTSPPFLCAFPQFWPTFCSTPHALPHSCAPIGRSVGKIAVKIIYKLKEDFQQTGIKPLLVCRPLSSLLPTAFEPPLSLPFVVVPIS